MVVHETTELPAQVPTLQEAIHLLGRVGGYLPSKGDKGPGTTTLWRGLVSLAMGVRVFELLSSTTRPP